MTAGADFWADFELDPRLAAHAGLRAADDDRELVLRLLGEAYADGRLTPEELDERATGVAAARLLGDLPRYVTDLVRPSRVPRLGRAERAAVEARVAARLVAVRARRVRLLVLVVLASTALWWVADASVLVPLVAGGLAAANVARAGAARERTVARELVRAEWTLRDRAERRVLAERRTARHGLRLSH